MTRLSTHFILTGLLALLGTTGCGSDAAAPAGPMQPTALPHVTANRTGAFIALRDGRALLVGGISPTLAAGQPTPVNDTEIYDPATNAWTTVAPMPAFRSYPGGAAVPDGRVFVIGDDVYSTNPGRKVAEIYNPATDMWTRFGIPEYSNGATYDRPTVVALPPPGNRVAVTSSIGVVVCDLDNGTSRNIGGAAGGQGVALALLPNGNLLATSGAGYAVLNPNLTGPTGNLVTAGRLQTPRYFAGAVAGPDGRVYIAGGIKTNQITMNQQPVRGVEVFDTDSARLLRRPPAGLDRTAGYATRGFFYGADRLLFATDDGGSGFYDLQKQAAIEGTPFPALNSEQASPTQLADGRLLFEGTITDLTKYAR